MCVCVGVLDENQAGFREGHSTIDHIFSLNTLFEMCQANQLKLYCAFIDFSMAFDSVGRIELWRKLLDYSINGKIVPNMYNGIKSSISFNGINSYISACVLLALYLNDLESYLLHKNLDGITIDITTEGLRLYLKLFSLLYADDTVLMANNPDDLQNCLRAFAEYCEQWKLSISTGKHKIVIFGIRKNLTSILY